jgi:hypothetical protein
MLPKPLSQGIADHGLQLGLQGDIAVFAKIDAFFAPQPDAEQRVLACYGFWRRFLHVVKEQEAVIGAFLQAGGCLERGVEHPAVEARAKPGAVTQRWVAKRCAEEVIDVPAEPRRFARLEHVLEEILLKQVCGDARCCDFLLALDDAFDRAAKRPELRIRERGQHCNLPAASACPGRSALAPHCIQILTYGDQSRNIMQLLRRQPTGAAV